MNEGCVKQNRSIDARWVALKESQAPTLPAYISIFNAAHRLKQTIREATNMELSGTPIH